MRSITVFAPLFALALFLSACASGSQITPPNSAPQQVQAGSDVPMDGQHIFYPLVGQQRYADRTRSNPNLQYGGGAVMRFPKVYVVYWGWTSDPSGEQPYLQAFLGNVGGSAWLNTVTQYYSNAGSITNPTGQLAGTWADTLNAIPSRPTDSAIATEALRAIVHFTGMTSGWGGNVMVMVATPHGNSTNGFRSQWCAYHSYVTSGTSKLAYTNFPYQTDAGSACGANFNGLSPGELDGVSIVGGHEFAESITDPYPSSGWVDPNGSEIGDKCAWSSASTDISIGGPYSSYAVQPLWSNAISGCATQYP